MIGLFEAAWQVQTFCDSRGWRSCLIGGIAVQRWGEPRVTLDVDVTLLTGFGGEDRFIDAPGRDLRTCSAEDLIVLKLFALRPLDVRDAETVAIRQKGHLDWRYVEEQLRPLAEIKDDPRMLETLAILRTIA
jgi:hypothetical protein